MTEALAPELSRPVLPEATALLLVIRLETQNQNILVGN